MSACRFRVSPVNYPDPECDHNDFKEIMASKVRVHLLEGQISKELSMESW